MINGHTSGIKYLVLSILVPSFFIISCDAFATSYSIIYDDNVVSNMPTDVNDKTFGTTVTVTSTIPTRPGYNNIGWCSVIPTYLNGVDTCTGGTQYDASDDLTIDQTGSSNDFHLYAMWQASFIPPSSCPTPVPNVTYMQEFATMSSSEKTTVLNSMTEDSQYYLADSRDEKTYCVSKLKDGNIWMTQNLDFNIVNGGADLDSTNTDVPVNWADGGNLADTLYTTSDLGFDASWASPVSQDLGDYCWNGVDNTAVSCNQGNYHYRIGNYYNWTAAVAMSDSSSYELDETINQSLCPAGWTLPKAGSETGPGSFQYLLNNYGWNDYSMDNPYIWQDPLYYGPSGWWQNGNCFINSSSGEYWSSRLGDENVAYGLTFNSNNVTPSYDDFLRPNRLLVRCVAR